MKIVATCLSRFVLIGLIFCGSWSCNIPKEAQQTITTTKPALDSLTRDAGRNVALGFSENAKLITQQLIIGLKGITDTLDPDIRRLFKIIDSIGNLTDAQLIKLGTTLDSQLVKLKGEIKDRSLEAYLDHLVNGLTTTLNKNTRHLLSNILQTALDSLSSPTSKQKISGLVTSALNDSARMAVRQLVSTALQPSIDSIAGKIDQIVHKDVPFLQREAGELLTGLAVIALLIIGYVWYQRRKYARLAQILTYHIDKIPSKDLYDELTGQIQTQAQKENLEPLLRSTLKRQGINS
jgi:hypothetical protein